MAMSNGTNGGLTSPPHAATVNTARPGPSQARRRMPHGSPTDARATTTATRTLYDSPMRVERATAKRPRVRLRKDLSRHVRAGHPWIFADALAPVELATGTVVDVLGVDGQFLARGLYEAGSPIAVRVATLDEREEVDGALVR